MKWQLWHYDCIEMKTIITIKHIKRKDEKNINKVQISVHYKGHLVEKLRPEIYSVGLTVKRMLSNL